jgi:tetratricopeptide (TPR) repeat protein
MLPASVNAALESWEEPVKGDRTIDGYSVAGAAWMCAALALNEDALAQLAPHGTSSMSKLIRNHLDDSLGPLFGSQYSKFVDAAATARWSAQVSGVISEGAKEALDCLPNPVVWLYAAECNAQQDLRSLALCNTDGPRVRAEVWDRLNLWLGQWADRLRGDELSDVELAPPLEDAFPDPPAICDLPPAPSRIPSADVETADIRMVLNEWRCRGGAEHDLILGLRAFGSAGNQRALFHFANSICRIAPDGDRHAAARRALACVYSGIALCRLGWPQFAVGAFIAARDALNEADEWLNPLRVSISTRLASLLWSTWPKFRLAVAREGLSIAPSSVALVALEAGALSDLGQWHDALAAYSVALERDPAWYDLHCDRGHAWLGLSRHVEAERDFNEALLHATRGSLTEAFSQNGMGLAAALRGSYPAARAAFARSEAIAPGNALLSLYRAKMFELEGRKLEATAAYSRALELSEPPLSACLRQTAELRLAALRGSDSAH